MKLFWKTTNQYKNLQQGTIVGQIKDMDIKSSLRSTLMTLRRANPDSRFVVCDNDGDQIILKVGRDILPHSVGVTPNR